MAAQSRLSASHPAAGAENPSLDYRTLVEQLPLVTYTVEFRAPKTVAYVSPQVEAVVGFTPDEYRRNQGIWPDRIDPRDRPAVLEALDRIRRTGEPLVCEYRFAHKDGRVLWIHDEATPVRDAGGRPVAMQGIMQDVTSRRDIERRLADAQALAHIGSWAWDLATGHITQTDEMYRIFGLERGGTLDFPRTVACVHAEDRARVERRIAASLRDGKPYRLEFRIIRPDGALRVIEAHAAVELDAAGHPIRKYGTAQDVTDRARAAAALRQAEKSYRDAVENAVEGVFRTTPDGRWVMANRALARMVGYDTPEQLMSARPDILRHHYVRPEDRARFIRLLETQGVVQGFEYEAHHRDGSTVWLRDHARGVSDGEGQTYYEGTVQNVTNRKRAEALLDQRTRQQAAVARLGQAAIAESALAPLMERAVSLVAETLDVDLVNVLERKSDGCLVVQAGMGWRDGTVGRPWPFDERSQASTTIRTGLPVIVNDWEAERIFTSTPILRRHDVRSGLAVVIGTPEHPFGVLGAHSATLRAFSVDDVNFLQGIASILAAAIVRHRGDDMRTHLLARAISAQEEERTRIARELHDETGQALSAILIGLRGIQDVTDLTEAHAISERLRDVTAQTIRDVGHIARGLRPSTLDDLGLVPALRRYAEDLGQTRGLAIAISDRGSARFAPQIETTLYRIIQEALTNVARHAEASSASVAIERRDGVVRATIQDDGRGFDVASALQREGGDRALGLVGMRERASLLGGNVAISSRRSGGVQIVVELPLDHRT